MRTVLVTGGAGFLGSHLCAALVTASRVLCVDDLSTGDHANIEPLRSASEFVFIEADISAGIPVDEPVHEIYNLACPASPPEYRERPIETLMACSAGVKNVLDLGVANNARIVQASTSEVYGDPDIHPQTEDYWGRVNPIGARSCYDEGKRFAESLIVNYVRQRGANAAIARIFNTYGPKMRPDDGRVVSNFINQALAGEDLTIYGDGLQTRSFCYVSDMVGGLMALMASDEAGPINLGNPEEFTMIGLAEKVLEMTGSSSRMVMEPLPEDDPVQRRPDITAARERLGWKPTISVDDGLKETIAWFSVLAKARRAL